MMPCPCCGRGDVFGEIEDPSPLLALPGEGWKSLSHGDLEADAADYQRSRPTPADPGEVRELPADDEIRLLREALTIYGDRVRMATSARPDLQQVIDIAFERTPGRPTFGGDSETRHPAALLSPLQVTNCLETGNGSKSFREGVEAAAKVADEESKRLFGMSQNAKTHPDEQDFHSGAGWYAAQIRDKILALPPPATAIRALASGEG